MNAADYHDETCNDCGRVGAVCIDDGWVVCKCGNEICEVEE